jgi:Zn-dependent protease
MQGSSCDGFLCTLVTPLIRISMLNFSRMPKTLEIPTPIKIERLTRIARVKGVDIYIHWTVFAIAMIILVNSVRRPAVTLVGLLSFLAVMTIHEFGHLIAARLRGHEPLHIEMYPIFGLAHFEAPRSRLDHCIIAWGGVVAQAVIAVPLVIWIRVFGYTRFDAFNAALALLGPYSAFVAIFNLLPFRPLDGATAWGLFPALIARRRKPAKARAAGWRGY